MTALGWNGSRWDLSSTENGWFFWRVEICPISWDLALKRRRGSHLCFPLPPPLWCVLLIVLIIQIIQEIVRLQDALGKRGRRGGYNREHPPKKGNSG